MVTIQCNDCKRKVEIDADKKTPPWTCKECGGVMDLIEKSDEEELNYNDEDEEDSETIECDECGNEFNLDLNEIIEFENSEVCICKPCIDKLYPRKVEIKEVPKFIDRKEPKENLSINFEGKTKFD